jgi:hypothetical protein
VGAGGAAAGAAGAGGTFIAGGIGLLSGAMHLAGGVAAGFMVLLAAACGG